MLFISPGKLGLSKDGQSLITKKLNEFHKHLVFEKLHKYMTRQRILPEDVKESV